MNTYERFLSALTAEFKQKAPPQFRSLWADLMEMEEATEERAFSMPHDQALRRIHALGCAACASSAHPVPSLSRSIEIKLRTLTHARAVAHPESVTTLHRAMDQLAEGLCSIEAAAPVPENFNQPTEALLVESCAD